MHVFYSNLMDECSVIGVMQEFLLLNGADVDAKMSLTKSDVCYFANFLSRSNLLYKLLVMLTDEILTVLVFS